MTSVSHLALDYIGYCWTRDGLLQGFPGAGADTQPVTRAGAEQRVGLKCVPW